jgi:hypothetical protein
MGSQSHAKPCSQSPPLRGTAQRAAACGLGPLPSVLWGRGQGRFRRRNGAAGSDRWNTLSAHVGGTALMGSRPTKTSQLDRWRKSAEFRQIARKSAKANIAQFKAAPRCGAARKRDGEPCVNPAMKNGRCNIHGGKTPSGPQWHVVQLPDCSTPAGAAKFNRKLRQQQRCAAKRAERLAAMTPDQRAKHDAWHRSHRPGAGAARSTERARVGQNAHARLLVDLEPSQRSTDPELIRIEAALTVARAKLAVLEARVAKPGSDDEGIFA